ncbi:hypothetical protein [Pseudaestuariivita rosea]|uniref:hypothetical protein n=1 Tax=Pseudaestuariivita rosea TaxID=2763263 RepID=UPI001ABB603C|nr:hypothetical protein [Pseudaestuariivita rosea]
MRQRGLLRFVRFLPAIQIARVIAALGGAEDENQLYMALRRKRLAGRFAPSDTEVAALRTQLGPNRRLTQQLDAILGVGL